jgi:hypothetical protein
MWIVCLRWALSLFGALPLIVSGVLNILKAPVMVKNMEHVGYSPDVLPGFGIIKVVIATLTLIP